ncbi:MAG: hypothetical protein ACFFB5_12785 [Promethearchaeota archaeon]
MGNCLTLSSGWLLSITSFESIAAIIMHLTMDETVNERISQNPAVPTVHQQLINTHQHMFINIPKSALTSF